MNRIYRQYPIINPEWDNDEDITNLHKDAEHDWDDDIQNMQFHNTKRWGDLADREYNKTE